MLLLLWICKFIEFVYRLGMIGVKRLCIFRGFAIYDPFLGHLSALNLEILAFCGQFFRF